MISKQSFIGGGVAFAATLGGVCASRAATPITHVIVIMQENRSFDHYFGTFPGADGFPANGCVPLDPSSPSRRCIAPFYNPNDANGGGPHGASDAQADIDDGITTGKQDGYVYQQDHANTSSACLASSTSPVCVSTLSGQSIHDVMGYHDARDIPNYWTYARNFVLQDRMFAGIRAWSLPTHLDLVSEWSALCSDSSNAQSCQTDDYHLKKPTSTTQYPWATLFQLLDVNGVSWKYYLGTGTEPDCDDDQMTCDPQIQTAKVPSIWNPAPFFQYIKQKGSAYLAAHDVPSDQFLKDVTAGALPQVSWIIPSGAYSEHPPSGVTAGMEYVTSLVNAVMQSPYWANTAIFITWDDWGGFYDHVVPPNVDANGTPYPIEGFGIRVPGLMISAYAKQGYIDHATYGFDSYATFVENLFTGGARLDPAQLGNPDNRPDIRDALTHVTFLDGHTETLGNFMNEFDFTQAVRAPVLLSTHIPTGINTDCGQNKQFNCTNKTVTITWNAVTGPEIPGPFIYHITRDGIDLKQCEGTATSCTDSPNHGPHVYRAFSVDQIGTRSPDSAGAVVSVP